MSPNQGSSKGRSSSGNAKLDVLLGILKPICRFAIRNSFRLQEIVEVSKRALVEAAVEEIEKKGEQVSVSRINVMTGIHRAMVDQILHGEEINRQSEHIVNRVIDKWQSDKRFCTAKRTPLVLQLDGMNSPFIKLIQSVSTDLNPYTILFELERLGVVVRSSKGVKLQKTIYLTKDKLEGYAFLAEDADDLISAVQENLELQPEQPNLHMKTEYNNIPRQYIDQIKHWLLKEGSIFHRSARRFLSQFDLDTSGKKVTSDERYRVAIGTFSITALATAEAKENNNTSK